MMFIKQILNKSTIRCIVLGVLFIVIFLDFPLLCQSHEHTHGHGHSHEEPPSFKYSKEANVLLENPPSSDQAKSADVHKNQENRDTLQLWIEALGSTLLISAAPFFILFLVPLDNSKEREPLLKVLLSFASGSLLGDAFLHLIPHALVSHSSGQMSHSHSHSHSHSPEDTEGGHGHGHDMRVGFWVLFGMITFLMVEKFVRLVKGGHGHSHNVKDTNKKEANNSKLAKNKTQTVGSEAADVSGGSKKTEKLLKEKKSVTQIKGDGDIKVAGYLNLAADFTHNFTDGLAIGASYLAGKNIGIVTTITILLHEVPHEIGDFAILIQSGCSRKKAIYLQLSTAVGALTGTVISLLAEGMGDVATAWILPFTAGGFIYIATVSVIPELLADTKFWQSVKEIIALLFGVYMMVLIAEYE